MSAAQSKQDDGALHHRTTTTKQQQQQQQWRLFEKRATLSVVARLFWPGTAGWLPDPRGLLCFVGLLTFPFFH